MKLTEETLQKTLHTPILNLSEADIRFVFHILDFDLKEYKQETGRIKFEVHNKITYIASIEITVNGMVFSNEWVNFGYGNEHGLSMPMPIPKCLGEIIVMFTNVFAPQESTLGWIDLKDMVRRNIFESEDEAKKYLDILVATVIKIVEPYNRK